MSHDTSFIHVRESASNAINNGKFAIDKVRNRLSSKSGFRPFCLSRKTVKALFHLRR